MPRRKIDKQDAAFWLYLALIILWALYGLRDSTTARLMLDALREAFQLILQK